MLKLGGEACNLFYVLLEDWAAIISYALKHVREILAARCVKFLIFIQNIFN